MRVVRDATEPLIVIVVRPAMLLPGGRGEGSARRLPIARSAQACVFVRHKKTLTEVVRVLG
jgi:hypothetical protein